MTWEDFRLEMRRLVEEAEKETAAQYHHLQKNDTHAAYTHTSTPRFKKSKKANHPHSPQKVEPAKEKLTIKQARNSQPNSLQLPKGPEIRPRSKGDSEHTERKTTVVHIKKGPRPEDEAMAQGLQKPPASSNQSIGEGDGRPNKSERLKESQGQHLTCPQNVEEDARNNKSTQATKEQITLQLAETIWVSTEAKDLICDPHKENTRCLDAKKKQEVTINNFLIPDAPPYHKTTSRRPYQYRGVVLTFQLKEDPPDLPPKIKPRKYQGKALESQKRMKPDLFYRGTGYTVSRLKPFQEIGYDIGTGTTPEPGGNRMHHSANRRTNQHMCFIKTAYLINQEEFCHETNFNAFYTQQRVRKN
ncbi:hypothetical protein F2Q68_00044045 [Brassica cretica]|nr:hypothetical protein F2Q68_00044045 [Brassica cretica]